MIGFPDFLSLNLNFQNQELCNNYAKGTTNGIKPLWRVLSLSSILSSFQMIILPFSYADKRGWDSAHPAFSCKEILDSGHSKGDGEYWIDPEKSGKPLRVYCDMSRYGGKRMNFFFWDTRTSTGVYLTWYDCYCKEKQLTHHTCASGQNASCARCCLAFRRVNCCFFFFMKTYNWYLVSFSNFVIVLTNW